jgi:hypothetical protein
MWGKIEHARTTSGRLPHSHCGHAKNKLVIKFLVVSERALESSAQPSNGGRPGRQKGTHAIPDRPNPAERKNATRARAREAR